MTQHDVIRADVRTTMNRDEVDALARYAEGNEQTLAQLVRFILRGWLQDKQTTEAAA